LACAITPISLEHMQQLGNTLAAIAQEKAAIIKPRKDGSPVIAVIAPQPGEAKAVIEQRCREAGARPVILGKDIQCRPVRVGTDGQDFVVSSQRAEYDLTSSLLGRHQVTNAAMAVGLCEALSLFGFNIRREAVRGGIAATFWPGRFEKVHENPRVILDGAHNPASCQTLAETFQDVFPQKKAVVILGMSDDKEKKGIIENLSAIAQEFILTQSRHPRAYHWKAEDGGTQIAAVLDAVEHGLKTARPDDAIVVTGSLFVVAEARRYFDESKSRNR
jgi:dihydrofolate synthase/folylpolyglutamate synthase